MTVLHLMQCTNLGGMEQVAYRLMDQLAAREGLRFRIATPKPFGPGKDRVLRHDPAARDFPYRGRFGWRDLAALRRHVRAAADGCDRVWITGTALSALLATVGLRQPKVLSHHYHHFEDAFSWLRWRGFYEAGARHLDAITYPTAFTRNEALRVAPWLKGRVHVVPNGVDIAYEGEAERTRLRAEARAALGLPADAWIVGNGGWLIRRKRFDVFLDVAARVAAALPAAHFVICGDGPERARLQDQAARLGLAGRVTFVGWVSDMRAHYRAWDAILFNSDLDAVGMTPLEAAAHGCLVVASVAYGGLSEFIDDGVGGILLGRHDVDRLADGMLGLASDPALALRMRLAALEALRARCGYEASAGFYRAFFGAAS